MNNKPTLSLGGKVSPETQNKLQNISKQSKDRQKEKAVKDKEAADKKLSKEVNMSLYKKCLEYFSKTYPKCFNAETPKPLIIGIHNHLIKNEEKRPEADRVSKKAIRKFLTKYTRLMAYKEAIQEEATRINLDGEEIEPVTPEHTAIAKKSLEELRNKQVARKKNNKKK